MRTEPAALAGTRALIDAVDHGLMLLLATRRQLALAAGRCKRAACLPAADDTREQQVRRRAARLARQLGVPAATTHALMDLAIADARRIQGLAPDLDQGGVGAARGMISVDMDRHNDHASTDHRPDASRWLRLLPPPKRWASVLRACPQALQRRWLEQAMQHALAAPLSTGALAFLQDRRLGIEVNDLGLRWVVTLDRGRLRTVGQPAEASVRGSATDLLLLAGRLEDADTLFFQRRLVLTGDTELGLTARNLLDRLPWEQVPLALRIALNRSARLAQSARAAYRAG